MDPFDNLPVFKYIDDVCCWSKDCSLGNSGEGSVTDMDEPGFGLALTFPASFFVGFESTANLFETSKNFSLLLMYDSN